MVFANAMRCSLCALLFVCCWPHSRAPTCRNLHLARSLMQPARFLSCPLRPMYSPYLYACYVSFSPAGDNVLLLKRVLVVVHRLTATVTLRLCVLLCAVWVSASRCACMDAHVVAGGREYVLVCFSIRPLSCCM